MDAVIRTNSGAPLITPWSARGMSNEAYAAKAKADEHKQAVQSLAYKAANSPNNKGLDQSRDFVKQKIEGIRKRLQILKKLFSGNPKEMARALGQIFKELKAALKEYKRITGQEADVSVATLESQASGGAPAATNGQDDGEQAAEQDKQAGDTSKPQDPAVPAEGDPATTAVPDPGPYKQAEQSVRDLWGQDTLGFVKDIRSLVDEIEQKMLAPARIRYTAQKPDKDTDKVFEDTEKDLKELRKAMEDIERDVKKNMSAPGMTLDTAA